MKSCPHSTVGFPKGASKISEAIQKQSFTGRPVQSGGNEDDVVLTGTWDVTQHRRHGIRLESIEEWHLAWV
jgi:hypothetical protein